MTNIPKILIPGNDDFPLVERALAKPNGLLAIGGDLTSARLLNAYKEGIFPWYNAEEPILWWSPNPRAVLFLNKLHISSSMRKVLRKANFTVTYNYAFLEVMKACAELRQKQQGTWITPAIISAYYELHRIGYAHSLEIWRDDNLIGGIYGVDLGNIFCGESMFSRENNASKIAIICLAEYLKQRNYLLIDCQIMNPHLLSLGAEEIPRQQFMQIIKSCQINY